MIENIVIMIICQTVARSSPSKFSRSLFSLLLSRSSSFKPMENSRRLTTHPERLCTGIRSMQRLHIRTSTVGSILLLVFLLLPRRFLDILDRNVMATALTCIWIRMNVFSSSYHSSNIYFNMHGDNANAVSAKRLSTLFKFLFVVNFGRESSS